MHLFRSCSEFRGCEQCDNQSRIHLDDNELRIKIMTVKVAQKMNNLFDMISNNNLLQFLACN